MKPELLCPAGNYEKMKAAFAYGADAVYFAAKRFGMRSAADNFTLEELYSAVSYAHERGKRAFLTLNTLPHGYEYDDLRAFLRSIRDAGLDAVICADLGVMALAKEYLPGVELHVSTQTSIMSAEAAEQYHLLGAKRVVLARELSLDEIREIRRKVSPELELEVFVHGAMCVSYSGRCLISAQMTGRDANRGACTQPCRWNFKTCEIEEEKRPGQRYTVEEHPEGSFILSSRDLCMIKHIPALIEAGIDSFKIEGRMKSVYYTAVTANAYRMAIDAYRRDPAGYVFDTRLRDELESVSHRDYGTGFFFGMEPGDAKLVDTLGYLRDKAYLAAALSYDESTGRAVFEQRNKLSEGETVELVSPGKFGVPLTVRGLKNADGEEIPSAPHPLMIFSMEVPFPVRPGDILRGAQP